MKPTFTRPLILASASVVRRQLLERLRLPFRVIVSDVDETQLPNETPMEMAVRLALAKALSVAARHPEAVVIGSDQVADLDGQAFGKPGSHAQAVAQLQAMRGTTVIFQSAVAVVCLESSFQLTELAQIKVKFRTLNDAQIEAYLMAEAPYDCAGSVKSEGLGIALLESVENDDPTAIMGLSLIHTRRLLDKVGIAVINV